MVFFEGSDVPLEEDILKKKRDFIKTWSEWATLDASRQLIINGEQFGAGSTTLLTVPENETFFVTSAMLNVASDTLASGTGTGRVGIINGSIQEFFFIRFQGAEQVESVAVSYPMPLIVRSGQVIRVAATGAATDAAASITGFFLPKKISE